MNIKAVIFDLDGTLVDSIEDIADANNLMLRKFNYPEHPLNNYVDWIGNGAKELVVKSLPIEMQNDENKISYCLRIYSELYKKTLVNKSKLYPGIESVLDMLEANYIPKSILTNKPQDLALGVADVLLSKWHFDHIIGQQENRAKKPDPTEANKITAFYGVKPENIAFIGDSHVDIQTAKNAGMQPIAVSWGYEDLELMKAESGVSLIHTHEELLNLLNTKIITYENKSS